MICSMVGHHAQRYTALPKQHIAYPYHQAVPQTHITSQHILASGLTAAPGYYVPDIYGLMPKQHSPQITDQPSPATPTQNHQGDHPIGYGAFGVVWSVVDPRDGTRKALKKMPNVFQNLASCRRVYRELKMLCHFKHENVLSAMEILQPSQYDSFQEIYVITELFQSDLHKIIVSPQPLSADHVKVFLYQILRGLKYLHSSNVIHRDIKPGNLLVNSNCHLKICDFGLARVEVPDENEPMTQEVVTQYYRPPEILMGARHYSYEIDIWSVGCIFAELLSRRILFQSSTPLKQLDMITTLLGTPCRSDMKTCADGAIKHMLNQPKKLPTMSTLYALSPEANHEAVHLICQMLVFDPFKRITAADALTHPYLDDGRMRYHSCMCKCCSPNPSHEGQGHRFLHRTDLALEPSCQDPFSLDFESDLTTLGRAKDQLHRLVHENVNHRVPLTINPHSITYRKFTSSTVAHASELPPSPHVWE